MRVLRHIAMLLAVLLVGPSCTAVRPHAAPQFSLCVGDLLFQDLDCGPLCDAIETVTQGINGAQFSHVGMVSRVDNNRVWVIEAVSEGVVETPLRSVLRRSKDQSGNPKVLVGRLDPATSALIPGALAVARKYLGRPYDNVYSIGPETLYCSELIYQAFMEANQGRPVFELAPMTFMDPTTKRPFHAWTGYYEALNAPIPEGQPGLNPGGISRSPHVRIVHAYGIPAGWSGMQ